MLYCFTRVLCGRAISIPTASGERDHLDLGSRFSVYTKRGGDRLCIPLQWQGCSATNENGRRNSGAFAVGDKRSQRLYIAKVEQSIESPTAIDPTGNWRLTCAFIARSKHNQLKIQDIFHHLTDLSFIVDTKLHTLRGPKSIPQRPV